MGNSNYKVSKKSTALTERTVEKSRHAGSILGLATISNQIITCSDDKTIGVSKFDLLDKSTISSKAVRYHTGHERAINRVVAFENSSGNPSCWTASRDLSIKCVRALHLISANCVVLLTTLLGNHSTFCVSHDSSSSSVVSLLISILFYLYMCALLLFCACLSLDRFFTSNFSSSHDILHYSVGFDGK